MQYFDLHTDILYDVYVHAKRGNPNRFMEYHYPQLQNSPVLGGIWTLYSPEEFDITEAMKTAIDHIPWDALKDYEIILGLEGMRNVKDARTLQRLYDLGVRHAMLTWNEDNHFAGGAKGNQTQGLTDKGKEVLDFMIEHDMIIDVSHLNEVSFFDVLAYTNKNIIASHNNIKNLCEHPRNLTDTQLQALKDANGLLGLTLAGSFIAKEKEDRTLQQFLAHVQYAIHKLGIERVCFGFDFMDYFEEDSFLNLEEIQTIRDITKITKIMEDWNFTKKQIEQVAHQNFLNKYQMYCNQHLIRKGDK